MKVLHVAPSYCRQDGGPSEVLRGMLPALQALGHDVSLVVTDKGLTAAERDDPPVAATTVGKFRGPYSLSWSPDLAQVLRRQVQDADVVHVHAIDNYVSVVAMREAVRANVPYVLQPHGAWDPYHRAHGKARKAVWGRLFQNRYTSQAAVVVVSSSREGRGAADAVPGVAQQVIPLGVDPALAVAPQSEAREGLLFLGRVAGKKRIDRVVDALALWGQDAATLTIAGPVEGDLVRDPHAHVEELGLASKVTFLGNVGSDERALLLGTHAAFVSPSEDESFGMAVAEAMVAGLAVVASTHVGVVEDLEAEGLCASAPTDPQGLLGAIQEALTPEGQLRAARLAPIARERFSWERVAERLDALYTEVA